MTAVTDHAGSKQADAITVPDFRQKLLASMQQSGVVDSLAVRELHQSGRAICSPAFLQHLHCLPLHQAQLRSKFVMQLRHRGVGQSKAPDASLKQQAVNSLFAQFLKSRGYE